MARQTALDQLAFRPVLRELYAGGAVTGRKFAGPRGLSTVNNIACMRAAQLELRPGDTLEIGLAFGGSALAMAATHKDLGIPAAGQHAAADPYQQTVWDEAALVQLERAGLPGSVKAMTQPPVFASPAPPRGSRSSGPVSIGGWHPFEDVFLDAAACARPPGGRTGGRRRVARFAKAGGFA